MIKEAKKFWNEKFGDLENPFLSVFSKLFKKHPGYIGPFIKLIVREYEWMYNTGKIYKDATEHMKYILELSVIEDSSNYSLEQYVIDTNQSLISCYELLIKYKQIFSQLNIDQFKKVEEFEDYLNNRILEVENLNYTKSFVSSKYYDLIDTRVVASIIIARDEFKMTREDINSTFFLKIAAYKNLEEFVNSVRENLASFNNFTVECLERKATDSGASIVYKKEGILIVETEKYESMKLLGSNNWCIVRSESYFKQYTKLYTYTRCQYIVYNTNLNQTDPNSTIGITIDNTGTIIACHDKNDKYIGNLGQTKWLRKLLNLTIRVTELRYVKSDQFILDMNERIKRNDHHVLNILQKYKGKFEVRKSIIVNTINSNLFNSSLFEWIVQNADSCLVEDTIEHMIANTAMDSNIDIKLDIIYCAINNGLNFRNCLYTKQFIYRYDFNLLIEKVLV